MFSTDTNAVKMSTFSPRSLQCFSISNSIHSLLLGNSDSRSAICRLFWIGVPVSMMRRRVLIFDTASLIADRLFLIWWPSSQITRSAPGLSRYSLISPSLALRSPTEPLRRS
uniref:Uncharacterized protein n=1 Tax=Anopheles merus TaxID=30066 RepID=A0A182VDQ0_ANOME